MDEIYQGNVGLIVDEVVITWINGSTSPADQPSFQEHPEHHQVKEVHPTT
jgi:hypothetical protein